MERNRASVSGTKKKVDREELMVVEWEEYDSELARFCSLSTALGEAKEKKQGLERKLESLIEVGF